ncbi:MAG: ATP-binding protein, partial [Chloroflexota bacterium]
AISVCEDLTSDRLRASVSDDGKGMDADLVARVTDPFVTSRTTRKVGLGIPLFKAAAEACNGCLDIVSQPGKGTCIEVEFQHSHIDRMPLGDLAGTILTLVVAFPEIHWLFDYEVRCQACADTARFTFDDQPVKEALIDISLTEPDVLAFLRQLLEEGVASVRQSVLEAI